MKPTIKSTMNFSTFIQYQPHTYDIEMSFDLSNGEALSRYDRKTFIKRTIEKLTNQLIKLEAEEIALEKE